MAERPRSPLPDTTWDGGVLSAETLGRGNTFASNLGGPASGSENPAALDNSGKAGSAYATALVNTNRSSLPRDAVLATDPLQGRILQYLSVEADKGVLFYEPLSRYSQRQTIDASAGLEQDVDYSANAIGFAGATKFHDGTFGISLAYLYSALATAQLSSGTITSTKNQTSEGLRLNLGLRYPTGNAMWGLTVQNAPAFLWGDKYRRDQLPLKVRIGNTYRVAAGYLLTLEGERRYYHEGGNQEDFLYAGAEAFLSQSLVLRAGTFGTNLGNPDVRHVTAGLTFKFSDGASIGYGYETFLLDEQRVKRSVISLQAPLVSE